MSFKAINVSTYINGLFRGVAYFWQDSRSENITIFTRAFWT